MVIIFHSYLSVHVLKHLWIHFSVARPLFIRFPAFERSFVAPQEDKGTSNTPPSIRCGPLFFSPPSARVSYKPQLLRTESGIRRGCVVRDVNGVLLNA